MSQSVPCLSTDQISTFIELSRQGNLRNAAKVLNITEQGVRSRLLSLEERLGVELYRKSRGLRRSTQLTDHGRRFLPHAVAFLERARDLCQQVNGAAESSEVNVVTSHYLILYVLIDAVRRFHQAFPKIRVRLGTRTEQDIEQTLLRDPEWTIGIAAPYESNKELEYRNILTLSWSLIAQPDHPLMQRKKITLSDLKDEPLILFERGSSGRQHVVDAFHMQGVTPRIEMETTHTEIIVRMVEAGLGVSIVPLLPSGAVTRGRRVEVRDLGSQIRPIHSGVLTRRNEALSAAAQKFVEFMSI